MEIVPPFDLLRPKRTITGMSAVLLPYHQGNVDWDGFDRLLHRTLAAGLQPAVNMDTGYRNLIDEATASRVLLHTASLATPGDWVAGAFVADQEGATVDLASYQHQIEQVEAGGGVPVIFQSHGLTALESVDLVAAYQELSDDCDRFIGFELGTQFAPFGAIYALDTYETAFLENPKCVGAKHSSLRRDLEWDRLRLRDRTRPDFKVFTGNDLAIDMVMYGSDYLLGLSAFAPDAFSLRDRYWAEGDERFHQLNDVLQFLGAFAFRSPTPGYKHDLARFLHLRGWLSSPDPHPRAPTRPDADDEVLQHILDELLAELPASGTDS